MNIDLSYVIGIKEDKQYKIPATVKKENGYYLVTVKKEDYKDADRVNILPQIAKTDCTQGYYIVSDQYSGMKVFLDETQDDHDVLCLQVVNFYGVKTPEKCFTVFIEGMKYESYFHYYKKGNENGANFILRLKEESIDAYEDITMMVYEMDKNADYNDMAKLYRDYKYANGLKTIKQKNKPMVDYISEAPEIRVRMGWKPVPAEIEYQTVENEPQMHVAVTFQQLMELMDRVKAKGIEKAQFCLVGWNKSGHDGRWPQIFPVEEKLGGEEGLKKAIEHAKKLGYNIVAHTNSSDAYTIADCFDENKMVKKADGTTELGTTWSGGRLHKFCAHEALKYTKETLPQVRDLGFEGVHYIDVLSVIRPYYCYDKNHPATRKDTSLLWREMFKLSKELFGGSASEGNYDFVCEDLDFALYCGFGKFTKPTRTDFKYEIIPLWELIYHGSVMACPSSDLVNVGILDRKLQLKFIEFGGRPAMYVYSRFVQESKDRGNWMGEDDLRIGTKEEMERCVDALKKTVDFYEPYKKLQKERMIKHEKLTDTLVKVTYENGASVFVNYSKNDCEIEGVTVKAMDYLIKW